MEPSGPQWAPLGSVARSVARRRLRAFFGVLGPVGPLRAVLRAPSGPSVPPFGAAPAPCGAPLAR